LIIFALYTQDIHYIFLLLSSLPVILAGVIEDIKNNLSPTLRLEVAFISALLAILLLHASINRTGIFFLDLSKVWENNQRGLIVQSWCLLASGVVCGALTVITLFELFQGHWREAAAWFIQIIAVWSTLYVGYLTYTFRSGEEFTRLAQRQFASTLDSTAVLPLFIWLPFPALVLRSVAGQIISSLYLHVVRPVKVGWCLPGGSSWIWSSTECGYTWTPIFATASGLQ